MWIDAGRTCDMDDNNRQIDWANGVVTVKVSHAVPAITFSEDVSSSDRYMWKESE